MKYLLPVVLSLFVQSVLSSSSSASAVCSQGIYALVYHVSDYPPAQSFCSSKFPRTATVTVAKRAATGTMPADSAPTTQATTTATNSMDADFESEAESIVSQFCSCITAPPTTVATSSTTTTSSTTSFTTTTPSTTTSSTTTSSTTTSSTTTSSDTTSSTTTSSSTASSSTTTTSTIITPNLSCPSDANFIPYDITDNYLGVVQGAHGSTETLTFTGGSTNDIFSLDSSCQVIAPDGQIGNIPAGLSESVIFFNTDAQITATGAARCYCTGSNFNDLACTCGAATILGLDTVGELGISQMSSTVFRPVEIYYLGIDF